MRVFVYFLDEVKVVSMKGRMKPSRRQAAMLRFDFTIESLGKMFFFHHSLSLIIPFPSLDAPIPILSWFSSFGDFCFVFIILHPPRHCFFFCHFPLFRISFWNYLRLYLKASLFQLFSFKFYHTIRRWGVAHIIKSWRHTVGMSTQFSPYLSMPFLLNVVNFKNVIVETIFTPKVLSLLSCSLFVNGFFAAFVGAKIIMYVSATRVIGFQCKHIVRQISCRLSGPYSVLHDDLSIKTWHIQGGVYGLARSLRISCRLVVIRNLRVLSLLWNVSNLTVNAFPLAISVFLR